MAEWTPLRHLWLKRIVIGILVLIVLGTLSDSQRRINDLENSVTSLQDDVDSNSSTIDQMDKRLRDAEDRVSNACTILHESC